MENRMHMNPKKIFSKLGLALFVMMFMIYAIQIGSVLRSFFPVLFTKLAMTPWFNWALTFVSFHVIGFAIFYLMTRNIPIEEKDTPKTMNFKQMFVLRVQIFDILFFVLILFRGRSGYLTKRVILIHLILCTVCNILMFLNFIPV